jgi:hypothetical protein
MDIKINQRTEAETAADNLAYETIKNEFDLLGKWEINIGVGDESYPYEIFQKGDEFLGIVFQNGFKKEILEKKGDEFHVVGVESGEFYRIATNFEMLLFDKDGDLGEIGYKATRILA